MKRINIKVKLYRGTTLENLKYDIKNNNDELFFTNKKDRALSYGNVLLSLDAIFQFNNINELKRFKQSDFQDIFINAERLKRSIDVYDTINNKNFILKELYEM